MSTVKSTYITMICNDCSSHLVLESGRLHHFKGSAIHLDQTIPPLTVGNCCGGFLKTITLQPLDYRRKLL